jgi:hypothetical protein
LGLNEALDDDIEDMINKITGSLNKSAFLGDRLITFDKSAAFLKDPKFAAALDKCAWIDDDRGRSWRVNTLAWAARKALSLEGDFVECGVFEGFMSHMLVEYLDFSELDRTFYLYDTVFAGAGGRLAVRTGDGFLELSEWEAHGKAPAPSDRFGGWACA